MTLPLLSVLPLSVLSGLCPLLLGMYVKKRGNGGLFAFKHQSRGTGNFILCWTQTSMVDDPVHGAHFYFLPYIQSTATPQFSQPSGAEMARAFSHLD